MKNSFLLFSILTVSLLSFGQFVQSTIVTTLSFVAFFILILKSNDNFRLPILFFFLPWSGFMKFTPLENTFFSFGLVLTVLIMIFKKEKISIRQLFLIFMFFIYTLIVKLLYEDPLNFRFFYMFVIFIFLIIIYKNEYKYIDGNKIILFFVVGTLFANFTSNYLLRFPHLHDFGKDVSSQLQNTWSVYRLSGFNGDPNRNALQILMAISALMTIKDSYLKHAQFIIKYAFLIMLIYFGLLTVSKLFYFGLFVFVFFKIIIFLLDKNEIRNKGIYIFIFPTFLIAMLFSGFFSEEFELLSQRIEMNESRNIGITSQRYDLQFSYLKYLLDHFLVLFFGRGLFTPFSPTTNVSHNTFIQLIMGIGIFGLCMFLIIISSFKSEFKRRIPRQNIHPEVMLSILILFISLMSLDIANMDILYFYVLLILTTHKNKIELKT